LVRLVAQYCFFSSAAWPAPEHIDMITRATAMTAVARDVAAQRCRMLASIMCALMNFDRKVGKAAHKSAFTRVFDALWAACPRPLVWFAPPADVGTARFQSAEIAKRSRHARLCPPYETK